MNHDILLKDGSILRFVSLGGHCVHITHGADGQGIGSGMNRYGIIDEKPLKEDPSQVVVCDNGFELADGCLLRIDPPNEFTFERDSKVIMRATELASRPEGGFRLVFNLDASERLYGLGDENREHLQKRGHRAEMVLRNVTSYIPIPFVMSSNGWAFLLNTTFYHLIDVDSDGSGRIVCECARGDIDFYLFIAPSMTGLLDYYTRLTGRPALLPRWAYGFTFVCDEREVRARDVLYEAYEFRRQGIPCDVIGLEPDWMEKHYDFSTDKKWSEKRFHIPFWLKYPQRGTFASSLHRMGFHLSLWLCCDYDLSEYEEACLADGKTGGNDTVADTPSSAEDLVNDPHLNGAVRMDTITKPNEPWFQHLRKFVDDGADAFKLDGANQVCFHPDRKWFNGMDDCEMHNLYPLLYNKQMTQGFREHTGRRPMVYSAGGYAGIQQYSATWTGDTGGGPKSIAGLMNLAMSGHSNGTCDLDVDNEAGIHAGMLLPWSQLLGWHQYTEPWFQGEDINDCFRFYAKARYRLLPYIYACAWEAHLHGLPIIRPMPLAFPEDENTVDICSQFMLGESLLVTVFSNRVYLPEGLWYNYWTKQPIMGGRWLEVNSPREWGDGSLPLGGAVFVKGGAILPVAPDMLFSHQKPLNELMWEIYAAQGTNSFTHYDDDGTTFMYEQGYVATTTVTCRYDGKSMTITEDLKDNGHPELLAGRVNEYSFFGLPDGVPVIRNGQEKKQGTKQ